MQIVILGSGSSIGVPAIGCDCRVCVSGNPRNCRTRSSILIQIEDINILVDTSPDLRMQALHNKLTKIDAVIYTHAHADHVSGIDDLRSFNYLQNGSIDIYGFPETLSYLENSYAYCFKKMELSSWYKPLLASKVINHGESIKLGGKKIEVYGLDHGNQEVLGLRIDNFAYSTDFKNIPDHSTKYLENLDLWIIDCLKYSETHGHLSFDESMALIAKYKPKRAVLCHLAHELDYEELSRKIPSNVTVAYDSMVINV